MRSVSVANRQKQEKGQRNLAQAGRQVRIAGAFLLLIMLLLLSLIWSICSGSVSVPIMEFLQELREPKLRGMAWTIIWEIRLPRALAALILGGALALSGYLLQTFFHNPIAGPFVLGISSGASAGAVSVIILGLFSFMGGYSVIFGATLGAAVAISLSLSVASVKGRITSTQLVLAGIATSALFSALTNLIVYGFNNGSDKTKMALYWMVGSLSGATWSRVKYVFIVSVIMMAVILLFARELDILLLGDDVAETLGADTRRIKLLIILASTVLTGVVVSVSGVIGFAGLVVPHVMRGFVGSGHKQLIPMSILGGGLFAMIADLISRIIIAPEELPIGVIAAFFGAPFFLYLIRKGSVGR